MFICKPVEYPRKVVSIRVQLPSLLFRNTASCQEFVPFLPGSDDIEIHDGGCGDAEFPKGPNDLMDTGFAKRADKVCIPDPSSLAFFKEAPIHFAVEHAITI